MIQALAPGLRRGCSWVWLSIVLAGTGWPTAVVAQETKPVPATPKGTTPPPASTKGEAPAAKAAPDAPAEPETPAEPEAAAPSLGQPGVVEVFKDPRAEEALQIFKSIPGLRDCSPNVISQVKAMAAGTASSDRETILRFVQGMAYRLIDKSNINGLIAPPANISPSASSLKAIKETSENLIDVIGAARLANNNAFLTDYNRALIETLPKLLDNNLVARIQAMIVLAQTGDPNVVPILLTQLKDKNQTVWVKLWATRGLYNVVSGGTRVDSVLSTQRASEASKAVVDFLEGEESLPWPAEMRGLETLGALRQASMPTARPKVEMAVAAMKRLADPEARLEVRAAASWALGMVRVDPSADKYNFPLVAYGAGTLAAELGEVAARRFSDNPTLSEYMAGLLVGPVFQTFNGLDQARESGLLKAPSHPNLTANLAYIRQIADLESSVARAAIGLVRAAGAEEARKKDLEARVATLKTFLAKNPPKDFFLVPGGDEFRIEAGGAESTAEASATGSGGAAKPAAPVAQGAATPKSGAGVPGGR